MRYLVNILVLIMSLIWVCGCERQQDLCYNHEEHDRQAIDVVFDWSEDTTASPVSMSLYLYNSTGKLHQRYEFAGGEGGRIYVTPGVYTAIAVNSDTEGAKTRFSDRLETFEIWLRDAVELNGLSVRSDEAPRAPGTETERFAAASEPFWRARSEGLTVRLGDYSTQTLVMHLTDAVCHYTVEFRNVENLNNVGLVSASISGMSESMYLRDGSISSERVTVSYDLYHIDETTLMGQFMTFGHCGRSRARSRDGEDDHHTHSPEEFMHHVTLYAILEDGSQWFQAYDVTDQVHESPTANCHIIIDGLKMPDIQTGGGFRVEVDEWQSIEYVVPM